MFTGIIEATGTVTAVDRTAVGLELSITLPWTDVREGESIAVNGACLTVEEVAAGTFKCHVIRTSIARTAFDTYEVGRMVNLERALKVGDRLGGHLVQGHVDGVGTVQSATALDDARLLDIGVPADVALVSMPLGSITVDGVSLTVNALPAPGVVQISLIPFTLRHTTLSQLHPGDQVHLEADTIGKYVRHLLDRERGTGNREQR